MAEEKQKQKVKYKFGTSEIDLDNYIHNLGTNIQSYLNSKNWSQDQKQEFMNSYNTFIAGLQDQLSTNTNRFSTDDFGTIIDSEGILSNKDQDYAPINSDFYYSDKGDRITTDDYNLLKDKDKKKYHLFPANREVASYFNIIGDAIRKSSPQKENFSDSKFDLSKHGFVSKWNQDNFPAGGKADLTPYLELDTVDQATGVRGTTNRAAYLRQQLQEYMNNLQDYDYTESPFQNKDTYRQRLQEAIDKLGDGYNSNDVIALNRAGISSEFLDNFFHTGAQQSETQVEQAKRDVAEMQKQQEEEEIIKQRDKMQQERQMNQFFDNLQSKNPFQFKGPKTLADLSYSPLTMNSYIAKKYNVDMSNLPDNYKEQFPQWAKEYINFPQLSKALRGQHKFYLQDKDVTSQHIANNLDYAAQYNLFNDPKYLNEQGKSILNDGYYVIPGSENYDDFTFLAYNPTTRQYYEQSMLLNDILRERMAYEGYKKAQKHQLGGALKSLDEQYKEQQKRKSEKEDQKKRAEEEGTTIESIAARERKPLQEKELSAQDRARLAAAALDIGSVAASFVPGAGTATSAALGVASTLTNLGADIADEGTSGWETAGNALYGLGMDAVGLIPGLGLTGKAAKIAKVLKPMSKWIKGSLQAYGIATSAKAFDKFLTNPSDMSVEDWRDLAIGLKAVSGQARYVGGKRAVKRNSLSKDFADVTTSSGNRARISKENLEKLRKTKGLDSQNKLFKELTGGQELQREFKQKQFSWNPKRIRIFKDGPVVKEGSEQSLLQNGSGWDYKLFKKLYSIPQGTQSPKNVQRPSTGLNINKLRYWYRTPKQQKSRGYGRDFGIGDTRNVREKKLGIEFDKSGGTLDLQKVKKYQSGNTLFYDWNKPQGATWAELVPNLSFGISSDRGVGKVSKGENYTFDTTARLNSVLNRINSGKMTVDDSNQMQTRHWGMYTGWNPDLGPIKNENVSQYQQDYQNLGFNDEIIAPNYNANYNIESNIPISGDSKKRGWTIDGLYSQITDDRRVLARKDDYKDNPQRLQQDIQIAKKAGYDYYLDPSTQYYMLRKIQSENQTVQDNPSGAPSRSLTQPNSEQEQKSISQKNIDFLRNINPTLLYGIPRAMYADSMNRRIIDLAKKSAVPLLKDPFEIHRAVRSDLDAEMQGERNYADLRRLASRPMTSDGNLQTASQLQAETEGQKARVAGKERSNQVQRQYDELAWQQEKENAANRHETAMFNRLQQWNAKRTKDALEQAYLSKKHNIWDTLMQQMEFEARQKREETKALSDSFARQDIHNAVTYSPNEFGANLSNEEMSVWQKVVSGTNPSSLSVDERRLLSQAQKKISQVESDNIRSYYKIPNTKWSGYPISMNSTFKPVLSHKNGAKIAIAGIHAKTADAERFQRQIKECIDRNEKAIDRLSKTLYGIIKSSMIK